MRILWFTNTSSCYKHGSANCYNGGGWISSLEIELKKRADVELGVCFYAGFVSELKKEEQDGTVYYILPRPKKSIKYIIETIVSRPEITTYKHEKLAIPVSVQNRRIACSVSCAYLRAVNIKIIMICTAEKI